jgi:GNAT superfamily N-acetyltransferase
VLTLRTATIADAEAIAALHAESWRYAYRGSYSDEYLDGPVFEDRREVWTKRLHETPANQYVVLAEEDGALIGFACAYGESDPRWGTLLDNLHVKPTLHRHGLGRKLVAAAARWTRENYPERGLFLWVLDRNERGRAFYAALGGDDVELRDSEAPGGGKVTAHRIAWDVGQLPALGAD